MTLLARYNLLYTQGCLHLHGVDMSLVQTKPALSSVVYLTARGFVSLCCSVYPVLLVNFT